VDRRKSGRARGSVLVVCCEGNAGFYESGIMINPVEAGYSVLGWNHPGFGGSTGMPFPAQEADAVDSVLQFSIHHLNFKPENIIIYGGVILDASFDDILPLAEARMPPSWGPLVRCVIKDHVNLNNIDNLVKYNGPVRIIRRTEDEIITTKTNDIIPRCHEKPWYQKRSKSENGGLIFNRGNDLLIKLLTQRYPKIYESDMSSHTVLQWLTIDGSRESKFPSVYGDVHVDDKECRALLESYVVSHLEKHGPVTFPCDLGDEWKSETKIQMALYLAHLHLTDYGSNHCTPLPASHLLEPWDINQIIH